VILSAIIWRKKATGQKWAKKYNVARWKCTLMTVRMGSRMQQLERTDICELGWANIRHIFNTRWLIRYAPRFHGKKSKKNSQKNSQKNFKKFFQKTFPKKFQKKIPKKIPKCFLKIKKLCLSSYACNRGSACEILGGLVLLV
jgi:hypothetical protein